ncbi:SufE family protein [Euzebya tangerina]|uniref:SufE family protein n=1 Tax=Euzebya tangerina TaxID=591198 RepID=UPI000E3196AE
MPLPTKLQQIVDDFAAAPDELRTELLLEMSDDLPPLPEGMDSSEMEQVVECQSPFFLATEVGEDETVRMWFDAPPQAPTTRGFAGILAQGLDGASREEVLGVEDDFHDKLNLASLISPLRMNGMSAILARLKRQVREAG